MAFRTNLVPAIEERTVSGSSVSFNSAFALPLKACKVSFSATQSGSGTPSPSNPLPISGVSAIGLNANSTPVSISLGDTRYGGELDLLTGVLSVTHEIIDMGSLSWIESSYSSENKKIWQANLVTKAYGATNFMCSIYDITTTGTASMPELTTKGAPNSDRLYVCDSNYSTANDFDTGVTGESIVYELAEPITIQLSATELSSIIGNNTFSTDTGTLEITFADLQEKSASGSVATFNTALAMPLVNGEFTIMAYQEGTGDPSPVNVRNIVPRREVNICNTSDLATWFRGIYQGTYAFINLGTLEWTYQPSYEYPYFTTNSELVDSEKTTSVQTLVCGGDYTAIPNISASMFRTSDHNKQICLNTGTLKNYLIVANSDYTDATEFKNSLNGVYIIYKLATPTTPTITEAQFNALLSSFNIDGAHYLVNLGEDVYGGSYNSVTGKSKSNYKKITLDGTETYYVNGSAYIKADACDAFCINTKIFPLLGYDNQPKTLCNKLKFSNNAIWARVGDPNTFTINNYQIHLNIANSELGITDYTQETPETVKAKIAAWVANNNIDILIPVAETETQLDPTPINTFNGSNNIFCDTGDSSVTYKDLDIAKRGSFREVFKLPS